ncbi:MAG: leucine-rich repeat protein [Eubacterium sp.]|nr:leucine-rich repeat protein [Eubacterium sp.]
MDASATYKVVKSGDGLPNVYIVQGSGDEVYGDFYEDGDTIALSGQVLILVESGNNESGVVQLLNTEDFEATSETAAKLVKVANAKKIKNYKVPKTVKIQGKTLKVTQIASKAFKGCKKLKKVTLSANVKKVCKKAFFKNKKLKKALKKAKIGCKFKVSKK